MEPDGTNVRVVLDSPDFQAGTRGAPDDAPGFPEAGRAFEMFSIRSSSVGFTVDPVAFLRIR
jgi:hypothetical protein